MRKKNTYSRFVQNTSGWPDSEKGKMIHLLHHCVEHDISTFDNADFHGHKYTDRTFGTALSESGLSRDEIQLISKVRLQDSTDLVSCVDDILLNLRTDYLDLLLLNFPSSAGNLGEDLEQLISQGEIMEIGGFELQASQFDSFRIPLRVAQLKSPIHSVEDFKALEAEKIARGEITGLVHCHFNDPITEGMAHVIKELSEAYNCSPNQLLLMWILEHPAHLHPVVYSAELEEIAEAVSAREKQLDPLDWQKIKLLLS